MICPKCERELQIGDWPWCGPRGDHSPGGRGGAIPDDIPGGLVMEHVLPGHKVYSKSELKRVLAQHGYKLCETHVTTPHTDKNPWTTRWT